MLSYGTQHAGYSREQMLICVLVGAIALVASVWGSAHLSDLVNSGNIVLAVTGIGIATMFIGVCSGPTAALFTECFPPEIRYSGVSLAYQLSNVIGGGFAPMITTALLVSGVGVTGIVIYVFGVAAISAISLVFVRRVEDVVPAGAVAQH